MTIVNPDTLAAPRGYSNGIALPAGRVLFVAGQIGWDKEMRFASDDLAQQFDQALANVIDVVRAAGGGPEHVGRFTIYVTDKREYLEKTREIGRALPTEMTVRPTSVPFPERSTSSHPGESPPGVAMRRSHRPTIGGSGAPCAARSPTTNMAASASCFSMRGSG